MNEHLPMMWLRTAGCGCAGLTCWSCGREFVRGDKYVLVGATKLCWLCLTQAASDYIHHEIEFRSGPAGYRDVVPLEQQFTPERAAELGSRVSHPDNIVDGDIFPHGERNGR